MLDLISKQMWGFVLFSPGVFEVLSWNILRQIPYKPLDSGLLCSYILVSGIGQFCVENKQIGNNLNEKMFSKIKIVICREEKVMLGQGRMEDPGTAFLSLLPSPHITEWDSATKNRFLKMYVRHFLNVLFMCIYSSK